MITEGLFSSNTPEWATPQFLYDALHAEFGFDLDVCANSGNAKCKRFFGPQEDGLKQDWGDHTCWMNPPYGREIAAWMKKAYEAAKGGALVVCLVPSRTDTRWWHKYAQRGEVRFMHGRLKFGDGTKPAPFPSAVVIFRPWCVK